MVERHLPFFHVQLVNQKQMRSFWILFQEQVAHKKFLSPHALRAHIKSLEKEVKVAQSKGFLDFDLPQLLSGIITVCII